MKVKNLWILILIVFLGACKKKSESIPENNVFTITESFKVEAVERTYLIKLPANYYDANNFGLIIALHGGGGSGAQFEKTSLLTAKANLDNFVVVYPDGVVNPGALSLRTWNAGECCGYAAQSNINDVGFITQLIDKLVANYKINAKKVYATGHSNGGMLAYRLAAEKSNKIAAIGVSACTMVLNQPLTPLRAVPILHVHSVLDKNVPLAGGYGIGLSNTNYPPVLNGLLSWVSLNNCNDTQKIVVDNPSYTFANWATCNNNTSIQFYLTKDGGHAWAGGLPGSIMGDTPSAAINMNDLLIEFFKKYQLP